MRDAWHSLPEGIPYNENTRLKYKIDINNASWPKTKFVKHLYVEWIIQVTAISMYDFTFKEIKVTYKYRTSDSIKRSQQTQFEFMTKTRLKRLLLGRLTILIIQPTPLEENLAKSNKLF